MKTWLVTILALSLSATQVSAAAPKHEKDDITAKYQVQKACVLQALVKIKGGAFGKKSAEELHDLIWTDKKYAAYKQYDDDSVWPHLLVAGGFAADPIPKGATVGTLPGHLAPGEYLVVVAGSAKGAESHMVMLTVTKKGYTYEEYDQMRGRGFVEAGRLDQKAAIAAIYK